MTIEITPETVKAIKDQANAAWDVYQEAEKTIKDRIAALREELEKVDAGIQGPRSAWLTLHRRAEALELLLKEQEEAK